jgi:hypothetical protein
MDREDAAADRARFHPWFGRWFGRPHWIRK